MMSHVNTCDSNYGLLTIWSAQFPNLALSTLHRDTVVGLGGEDEIGEGKLAVGIENFYAALVDEDQHTADFSVGGGCRDGSKDIAEVGLPTLHAVYRETVLSGIIAHHHTFALAVGEFNGGIAAQSTHLYHAGISQTLSFLAEGFHDFR